MSFTSIVKNEVSKIDVNDIEKVSELSAIVVAGAELKEDIKLVTENSSIARRIYNLFKDLFQINCVITMRKGYNYQKKQLYILQVKNRTSEVLNDLGLMDKGNILPKPKEYILADEEEVRSFIRGVFLMTGSINDPKTSRYHLEFLVDTAEVGDLIKELLNRFNLNAKMIRRDNKYMVYMKEAEKIGDFLRVINAYNAVMYYEDIRIYRDHKNMTNRLNNCEQANVDRLVQTANNQLEDIELINEKVGLDILDEKEQIVAIYRLKYRDVSLAELGEIISVETQKPITKSGVYHRFKKISEIANKIRENS